VLCVVPSCEAQTSLYHCTSVEVLLQPSIYPDVRASKNLRWLEAVGQLQSAPGLAHALHQTHLALKSRNQIQHCAKLTLARCATLSSLLVESNASNSVVRLRMWMTSADMDVSSLCRSARANRSMIVCAEAEHVACEFSIICPSAVYCGTLGYRLRVKREWSRIFAMWYHCHQRNVFLRMPRGAAIPTILTASMITLWGKGEIFGSMSTSKYLGSALRQ